MDLFNFRYRASHGVHQRTVKAKDLAQARQIAETWCAQSPGFRFIVTSVEPFIVADESILKLDEVAAVAARGSARVGA